MSWKSILKTWPEEILYDGLVYSHEGNGQYVGPEGEVKILALEQAKTGEMELGQKDFGAKIQRFQREKQPADKTVVTDEYIYEERDEE